MWYSAYNSEKKETGEKKMKQTRWLWRWPIAAMALAATFWGIWSLFAPVPTTTSILISKDNYWQLPVAISRWWDIPTAGLWALLLALFFGVIGKAKEQKEDLIVGLGVGLVVGLGFGLVVGLGFGLGFGLSVGLGAGLGFLIVHTIPAFRWLGRWLAGE